MSTTSLYYYPKKISNIKSAKYRLPTAEPGPTENQGLNTQRGPRQYQLPIPYHRSKHQTTKCSAGTEYRNQRQTILSPANKNNTPSNISYKTKQRPILRWPTKRQFFQSSPKRLTETPTAKNSPSKKSTGRPSHLKANLYSKRSLQDQTAPTKYQKPVPLIFRPNNTRSQQN